jgi:hypothetical protein
MLTVELLQDSFSLYYKGRKIPAVPLYATPLLHYVQYVAPYVAKRLVDAGIRRFRMRDARAARIIELACGGMCTYAQDGDEVEGLLEEAYYNLLADRLLAYTVSADAVVVPCADPALARALMRRAREYAPDLATIASQHGGECPDADIRHTPRPIETPLPLGPASRAAVHTAIWALEEAVAESPLTPLLDWECNNVKN